MGLKKGRRDEMGIDWLQHLGLVMSSDDMRRGEVMSRLCLTRKAYNDQWYGWKSD